MAYLSLGTFTQKGGHQFARELSADFSLGDWVQAIGMDATETNPKWWGRKQNPLNSIWFPAGQKHFPGDQHCPEDVRGGRDMSIPRLGCSVIGLV